MQIMLKNIRMAFPALAVPQSLGDGDPAYGAKFVVQPKGAHIEQLEEAIAAVAEEKWGAKADSVLKMLREDNKICFVKKEYRSKKTGEAYSGFEGAYYLSARNASTQPTVYDQYGESVEKKSDIERKAYSGAVVHASLEIWAQDNQWGRRVNCALRGVMLTGEGDNLGGGSAPASADEFSELAKPKADAEALL
jgi:hypothetical protein